MSENLVSNQVSKENLDKVQSAVDELNTILQPLLINLSPDQKQEISEISNSTQTFVERVLHYARSNPEFTPPYLKPTDMELDFTAAKSLLTIYDPLWQLLQQLNDNIMLFSNEAYVAALTYYNSVIIAARMNVENAKAIHSDLRQYFEELSERDQDQLQ